VIQTNKEIKRVKMKPEDIWNPFFLIYSLNLIILIAWTVADPQTWQRYPVNDNDGLNLAEPDTYGTCDGDSEAIYFSILLLVNIAVVLTGLVQSYECRKITTEYYENIWIGVTLIWVLQVWLVGLPVLSLFYEEPTAQFLARTGVMISTSVAPLIFIFGPKLKYMVEAENRQSMKGDKVQIDPSEFQDETSTVQESVLDGKLEGSMNFEGFMAAPRMSEQERSRDNMRRMHHRISNSTAMQFDPAAMGEQAKVALKLQRKVEKAQEENLRLLAQLESYQKKLNKGTTTGKVSFDGSFMGSDSDED
jgi:hypothetical protein